MKNKTTSYANILVPPSLCKQKYGKRDFLNCKKIDLYLIQLIFHSNASTLNMYTPTIIVFINSFLKSLVIIVTNYFQKRINFKDCQFCWIVTYLVSKSWISLFPQFNLGTVLRGLRKHIYSYLTSGKLDVIQKANKGLRNIPQDDRICMSCNCEVLMSIIIYSNIEMSQLITHYGENLVSTYCRQQLNVLKSNISFNSQRM